MKKQYIIANWKSHKTVDETEEWFEDMALKVHEFGDLEEKVIIVCPPFPLLPICKKLIHQHKLPFFIGSQDISPFAEGAYTGAVDGKLIREFADYAIIGHSERRKYFGETPELLAEKVGTARAFGLQPIYCTAEKEEKIPVGVDIVAYEPVTAIGSGHPDSPENAEAVAGFLKQKNSVLYVLYGGSVTATNVNQFSEQSSINGVLVGGASLSPQDFAAIIHHA